MAFSVDCLLHLVQFVHSPNVNMYVNFCEGTYSVIYPLNGEKSVPGLRINIWYEFLHVGRTHIFPFHLYRTWKQHSILLSNVANCSNRVSVHRLASFESSPVLSQCQPSQFRKPHISCPITSTTPVYCPLAGFEAIYMVSKWSTQFQQVSKPSSPFQSCPSNQFRSGPLRSSPAGFEWVRLCIWSEVLPAFMWPLKKMSMISA